MELTGDPGDSLSQQCSNCDSTSAACWCLDCNEALCTICVSAHRRVTVTRSHRLLHHPPEGNILSSPTKFCRLHPSEPLKLICFTCKQLTCRDCQLTTHMNHRYQFVSETVVSLKKQLDMYAHSIKSQEDTVRQSLQDMETRLQLIEQSESHLRTLLQERFITFAKLLKAKMITLHKDMQKVHELECQQIQGRMMKLRQLQQSQISVKETLEKARSLSNLPSLLTHTVQIKSEMKDLLDQDSDPPLKMPEVELVTKKGYEETLSELCKLHVSWIPFSVLPTSDKNTETPAIPAVPPPTSTCNPISSTVMDSTSGSPSLDPLLTSSSAQFSSSASKPRRDSISSMISSSPQTESPSCHASPVSNDCVATPSPTSSPLSNSCSAFNKFSSNLTLYNLLTKDHIDARHPVNPQSASSQSDQLSQVLPPTSTSPAPSSRPLLPSCSSLSAPASHASPLCTHSSSHQHFPSSHSSFNSSFSTSITSPAHTSTFPQHTDPVTHTGKTLNCSTPVTISALPSQSVSLSDQVSMLPSSTTPRLLYPSPITHSTSTQPVPIDPIKTGTTSDILIPVTMTTFSSLSTFFSSQLKLPPSSTPSTSSSPVFTGSITQTSTSSDICTPVTINSLTSPSAHLTNQLSIPPSSVSSVFSSLSTTLSTSTCPAASTRPLFQTVNTSVTKTVAPDSSSSHPSVWLLSYNQSNRPLSSSICPSSVAPLTISSIHSAPYSKLLPKTANTRKAGAPVQINSFSTSLHASPNQFKPLVTHSAMVLACSTTTSSTMPPKFMSTCPVSSCSPLLQTGNSNNTNLLFPVSTSSSTSDHTTSSLVNSSINPRVSTFSGLTNRNTASLVPVSIPSFLWNNSSTSPSLAFTHSSSATPLTSTCSVVTSSSLLHTTYSLVPVSCLSTSQIFTTTVTPTLHSFINSPGSANGNSSPTCLFLPQTNASRASVVQCLSMLPPGSSFPLSVSQSLPIRQPPQPLRVLNQAAMSHQNQPTIVMLTNTQSTYQVLLNETAVFKLPDNHASHLAIMQKPSGLMESTITEVSPETSTGNSSSSGPSSTLPSNQQTAKDQSSAVPNSSLSSLQELDSDSTFHSSSSWEQSQQIPVADSVVDSRDDNNAQQTEKAQETKNTKHNAVVSEETKLTPFVSEETEPEGKPSALETSGKESEDVSAVIGQQDFSLSQWQPKVSVFRLPISLPSSGQPLPSFRLLPGDTEDEIYLEEMSEDSQSDADDVSGGREDYAKPLSSPDSPVTLEMLSCSVCASPGTSIICSACGRGYHRDCHIPPVGPDFWSEWVCSICQDLSDPSDPYSAERFQRTSLSLQSQRRCESLVLYLKVEVCSRCSEFGGLSRLKLISDRLILRRPPPYQTAAQLVSDMWALFKDASQDDELNKLQESFQKKLVETLSTVLHPSLLTAPTANPQPAAGCADSSQRSRGECESSNVEEDADLIPGSKLKEFRKRLRDFLDLKGSPGTKRAKREDE